MKKTLSTTMVLLTFFISGVALADEAPAPCVSLKDNIARKIIRNGVPAVDFKLDIVAKDEVAQAEGKVVGNCGFGSHRIVYTRGKNINPEGFQFGQSTVSSIAVAESEVNTDVAVSDSTVDSSEKVDVDETTGSDSTATTETEPQTHNDSVVPSSNNNDELSTDSDESTAGDNAGSISTPESTQPESTQSNVTISVPDNQPSDPSTITNADNSIIIHR